MVKEFERIQLVYEHIRHVQDNCYKLGLKLIKLGEIELGRALIQHGQVHDNSKFEGIEWEHLFSEDPLLKVALQHHQKVNAHHPEYWGNIQKMPEVYLAEMVCDWGARSSEFGTSLREWATEKATSKYGFTLEEEVGIKINRFLNLLCDKPF